MGRAEVLFMNRERLTLGKLHDSKAYCATDFVFSFIFSTRKRMSVVVRTPEGKIKLYCKGAVSTKNNFDPSSFKDRCVCVTLLFHKATTPLLIEFCGKLTANLLLKIAFSHRVSFKCSFNRIQSSLSGYKTNRCTWTVPWSTWKILPKRVSEQRVPCSLNLSSIFINWSKAQVHSERSQVSWRKEVIRFLATAGSVNFLRWGSSQTTAGHTCFPSQNCRSCQMQILFPSKPKTRPFTKNVCMLCTPNIHRKLNLIVVPNTPTSLLASAHILVCRCFVFVIWLSYFWHITSQTHMIFKQLKAKVALNFCVWPLWSSSLLQALCHLGK